MSNNPYESPSSDAPPSTAVDNPKTGLATWSLVLAILLVFSPFGADILLAAHQSGSVTVYAALVAVFFLIVTLPLVFLYFRSGISGLAAVPIRIAFTVVILALYLVVHVTGLVHLVQ